MKKMFLETPVETVTWINARNRQESRIRRFARDVLKLPINEPEKPDFQSFIPAQDIDVLQETNAKLASILREQLERKRLSASRTLIPVVDQQGVIKHQWLIPTKPLITFTETDPIDHSPV